MEKIAIIGLGLVGNSIGMGVRRAVAARGGTIQVVGLDPERTLEDLALRKYNSVDSIAPDLETAVRGATLVILATPPAALREVLAAIDPYLDEGATVTDTLSTKEQVLSWAGELLTNGNFVGGHPISRTIDTEAPGPFDEPSADLFSKAPYCIIPLPRATNDALNSVIGLAEWLGASPLFIDALEHDSLFAAASQLPFLAAASLMRVTSGSPSWGDIASIAQSRFGGATAPMTASPEVVTDALSTNKQVLIHWLDQYLLVLQDFRDMLSQGERAQLLAAITEAHNARTAWQQKNAQASEDDPMAGRRIEATDELRTELQDAIRDSRPTSRFLGKYLSDRVFGSTRKDK